MNKKIVWFDNMLLRVNLVRLSNYVSLMERFRRLERLMQERQWESGIDAYNSPDKQ